MLFPIFLIRSARYFLKILIGQWFEMRMHFAFRFNSNSRDTIARISFWFCQFVFIKYFLYILFAYYYRTHQQIDDTNLFLCIQWWSAHQKIELTTCLMVQKLFSIFHSLCTLITTKYNQSATKKCCVCVLKL